MDATRFVRAIEPGESDSVEQYAKRWEGMTLEEVHRTPLKVKEQGEI